MAKIREVAIIRRVVGEEIELLRFGVPYGEDDGEVVALGLFYDSSLAELYVEETEGLALADGWRAATMGLGDLVAVCAAFGIDYVAFPTGPGLADSYVGPVLEVAENLASS